jgi:chromosome partitioning protein
MASCMSELGKKVLCIDLDSQGNLTQILNVSKYNHTIYDCLCKDIPLEMAIVHTDFGVDVLPSDINLSNADIELLSKNDKEFTLKKFIYSANFDYDYILIDCLPSLNLLTINALVSSNSFIIPLEASILSIYGLNQLIKVVKLVQNKLNHNLKNLGVFLAKVDSRSSLSKEFNVQLNDIFGDKLFDSMIHLNTAIVRSQIARKPINYFDKSSKGYNEYMNLTKEVIERG